MSNILSRSLPATFPQAVEQRRVQSWNDSVQDQLGIEPYGQTYAYQNHGADAFGNRNRRQMMMRITRFNLRFTNKRLLHGTPGRGNTEDNTNSSSHRIHRKIAPAAN